MSVGNGSMKLYARGFQSIILSSLGSDGIVTGRQCAIDNVRPDYGSTAISLTVEYGEDMPTSLAMVYPMSLHIARLKYQNLEEVEIFYRSGKEMEDDVVFVVSEVLPQLETMPKTMVGIWRQLNVPSDSNVRVGSVGRYHISILEGPHGRRIIKGFLQRCSARGIGLKSFDIEIQENYLKMNSISEQEFLFPLSKFLPGTPPQLKAPMPDVEEALPSFPVSNWPIPEAPPLSHSPVDDLLLLSSPSPEPKSSTSGPPSPTSGPPSPSLTLADSTDISVADFNEDEITHVDDILNIMDATEEELYKPPAPTSATPLGSPPHKPEDHNLEIFDKADVKLADGSEDAKSWIEVLKAELGLEQIEMDDIPESLGDVLGRDD